MKNDVRRGRDTNTSFKKEEAERETGPGRKNGSRESIKKKEEREKKREEQLRLPTGVKESLDDEDRTFANIDEEGIRSPTPNELDE